jgi:hypothetical protein
MSLIESKFECEILVPVQATTTTTTTSTTTATISSASSSASLHMETKDSANVNESFPSNTIPPYPHSNHTRTTLSNIVPSLIYTTNENIAYDTTIIDEPLSLSPHDLEMDNCESYGDELAEDAELDQDEDIKKAIAPIFENPIALLNFDVNVQDFLESKRISDVSLYSIF